MTVLDANSILPGEAVRSFGGCGSRASPCPSTAAEQLESDKPLPARLGPDDLDATFDQFGAPKPIRIFDASEICTFSSIVVIRFDERTR